MPPRRQSQRKKPNRPAPVELPPNFKPPEQAPSPDIIAQIAAILSLKAKIGEDPRNYVDVAYGLWKSSAEKVHSAARDEWESDQYRQHRQKEVAAIEKAGSYPISFKQLLRRIFPTVQKTSDRMERFRSFLAETTLVWTAGTSQPIGRDAASNLIADMKNKTFSEAQHLDYTESISNWWPKTLSKRKSRK